MSSNDNSMDGLEQWQIMDIIMKKMSDTEKQQLLHNEEFIEKHQITDVDLQNIILSLTEETRAEILMNKDLIKNKLHFNDDTQIINCIKELSSDEAKEQAMEIYEFSNTDKVDIVRSCSNRYKLDILLEKREFDESCDIIDILQSLDIETLSEFIAEQKEFCCKHKIPIYKIINRLTAEQQKEFVENLENVNLTLSEKKEILAVLKKDVKQSIDTTKFPEEYKKALSMQKTEFGINIILDWEKNLEDYRGLDRLIEIHPEEFTDKLVKLCDVCPELSVLSDMGETSFVDLSSTGAEYKEAEEWISSVIDNLNPEYSKAQKMAVIDNAIGKKISYAPDYDTEVCDKIGCRALWKIISSGYGVCNGIATVEQYILKRVGIESEIVSGSTHAFLKIKDIEIPLANGEIVEGNTILDPSWNLAAHRFGGMPDNFCIDYKQARKNDIDKKGKDHKCHKNDEQLQDATLNLDEQSLRSLFTSVGLADRDGQFPITDLLEKSELIDKYYKNQPEQNINKQFLLLKQTCPEFATCQNSTMRALRDIFLDNENLKFNKCVVDRVYNREDKEKRPIMYVYIDSNELGNKFYYVDKDEKQFIELSKEQFTKQFECYEEDKKKNKRIKTMGN